MPFQQLIGGREGLVPFLPLKIRAGDFPPGLFSPQAPGKEKEETFILGNGPVVVPVLEEIIPQAHLGFFVDDLFPLFLRLRSACEEQEKRGQEDRSGHGRVSLWGGLRTLCPGGRLPGSPVLLWEEISSECVPSRLFPGWRESSGAPPGGPR